MSQTTKQALQDALHVLDKSIEDLQEHRARIQEALEELEEEPE